MHRAISVALVLLGGVGLGMAQGTSAIPWGKGTVADAVEEARKTKRPLMFYVLAGSKDRDDKLEHAQKQAMADPKVVRLAAYFVPKRLSRSVDRAWLVKVGLNEHSNMEISFVASETPTPEAPNGLRVLDTLGASGVARADSLAQKMVLVLKLYRQQVFDRELRPVLENKDSKPAELRVALDSIRDLNITGADAAVVALIDCEGLDAKTLALAYGTLAELSTKLAVEKLLDRSAANDEEARKALLRCTPAAAELMLKHLASDDTVRLDVYHAVTKICELSSTKSDKWWENAKKPLVDKEIERVTQLVKQAAERWKKENEDYR